MTATLVQPRAKLKVAYNAAQCISARASSQALVSPVPVPLSVCLAKSQALISAPRWQYCSRRSEHCNLSLVVADSWASMMNTMLLPIFLCSRSISGEQQRHGSHPEGRTCCRQVERLIPQRRQPPPPRWSRKVPMFLQGSFTRQQQRLQEWYDHQRHVRRRRGSYLESGSHSRALVLSKVVFREACAMVIVVPGLVRRASSSRTLQVLSGDCDIWTSPYVGETSRH